MLFNTPAVVLHRRDLGEADRLVNLYTEERGRVSARFIGVRRTGARLKAFAEPFVHADYRLHLRKDAASAKMTGGKLLATFPSLRTDLRKNVRACHLSEMTIRLTPVLDPEPRIYSLLVDAFGAIDEHDSPWIDSAFGIRLIRLAGFGLEEAPDELAADRFLWEHLHESPLAELRGVPVDPMRLSRARAAVRRILEMQLDQPLLTWDILDATQTVTA